MSRTVSAACEPAAVDRSTPPVDDSTEAVKPGPTEVDAKLLEYPGSTAEEFKAYYEDVLAYVAPLCADLPPATGDKGAKKLPASVLSDL